jgi:hypothetical protein
MNKLAYFAAFFLCLASAADGANHARDMFFVPGIAASASAGSSSEAKRQALVGARERAFFVVVKRLLKSADVERVLVPDAYNMDKFIEKYKLANEKTGQTSYSASVDIALSRAPVEEYLRGQGLAPTLDASPPALVVPIDGSEVFGTPWADAFAEAVRSLEDSAGNTNIVPIVLPNANYPSDFSSAGIERMRSSPLADLSYVLSKNGASDIVLAELEESRGGYSVAIFARRSGESASLSLGGDLKGAAATAIAAINDMYKAGRSASGEASAIPAVVPISDLAGWLRVEAALAKIAEIKEASVQALKHDKAQLLIKYRHSLDSLVAALRSAGFAVDAKDGYLVIKK